MKEMNRERLQKNSESELIELSRVFEELEEENKLLATAYVSALSDAQRIRKQREAV